MGQVQQLINTLRLMNHRRAVIGDVRPQKEIGRASYDIGPGISTYSDPDLDDMPVNSSHFLHPEKYVGRMKYSEIQRTPSESNIRNSREDYFRAGIVKRKKSGNVNKLKSDLQNLKMEVSQFMNKGTDSMISDPRHSFISSGEKSSNGDSGRVSLEKFVRHDDDTVSITSQNIIDQPIQRLQREYTGNSFQNPTQFMELQNNVLKTELRNLKNKYNATKKDLKEKCEALQRKNQYLEVSLRRSEEDLSSYKRYLQGEMQTIKFQLARKQQKEAENETKRIAQLRRQPQHDKVSGDSEPTRDKINRIYEQLSEKNGIINAVNADLSDAKRAIDDRGFELKKQIEKNSELSKQLEFSKRETSRTMTQLQQEFQKKKQLQRAVESLKQRIEQLTSELKLKDQMALSYQQFESKLSIELQHSKELEQQLSAEICELNSQLRKVDQLNQSHEQEIIYLKNNISEFTQQIEQLSRTLRLEKEKAIGIQTNYRKMLDESKENDRMQIEMLKAELENSTNTQYHEESLTQHSRFEDLTQYSNALQQKDFQINKWKAEYKLLKMKLEENQSIQESKKEQIQLYYKSYTEYKSKLKIQQMRNRVLESSANDYIEKIQTIESVNLQERENLQAAIREAQFQLQSMERETIDMRDQINDLTAKLAIKTENLADSEHYRQLIERKVMDLDEGEYDGFTQILDQIKRRAEQQDEKITQLVKQLNAKEDTISQLRQEIKQILRNQEKDLHGFRENEIQEAVEEVKRTSFESLKEMRELARKQIEIEREVKQNLLEENAVARGRTFQMQQQFNSMKQEIKNITHLYDLKSAELNSSIDKHMREMEVAELKLEEQSKSFGHQLKNIRSNLTAKQEEVLSLRAENRKLISIKIDTQEAIHDQNLKDQVAINQKIKDDLDKKNQEVYRLRDSFIGLNAEYDNLKVEADIARLKSISERKNLQVAHDIETEQLRSALSAEQKKIGSFEQKIKMIVDENKKKDAFIQNWMARKLTKVDHEALITFMKDYQITVTGKNISQKLLAQSQELQRLSKSNFNLMKEVSELNEKLLLFEVVAKKPIEAQ